ncbi:hypothetical protein [Xanthomonas oryzae]|uniref:hypothetical protein n=1 Tax=Xanthomonas oryzae TaxID=347 RepID=UPI0030CE667B
MKAVTRVQQGIETEILMMKRIAMFSSLALLGFVGNATANDIHFCDSCTQAQRGVLATQLTSGLGQVYIGDRTTGVPYLYTVTTVNGPVSVAPPGIQEQPVSQADADQFTIYSSVYRSYENSGTLNVKIDLANGPVAPSSVSRMVEVASDESSAFAKWCSHHLWRHRNGRWWNCYWYLAGSLAVLIAVAAVHPGNSGEITVHCERGSCAAGIIAFWPGAFQAADGKRPISVVLPQSGGD